MPSHIITADSTSSFSLGADADSIGYVAGGVRISRSGTVFSGTGADQAVMIEGRVENYGMSNTVNLGGTRALVTVGQDGVVTNLTRNINAVLLLSGADATLNNEGRISGGMGVYLSGSGKSVIDNAGTIIAFGETDYFTQRPAAITLVGPVENDLELANTGLLKGGLIRADGSDFLGERIAIFVSNSNVLTECHIDNLGRIVGHVLTGLGADILSNSGLIAGDVITSEGGDIVRNWGRIGGEVDLGLGNDLYRGGLGSILDAVMGGDGNDTLNGGVGEETIYGEAGNDQIRGSDGDDLLDGGTGNDTMRGAAGEDTLRAGTGKDLLVGGVGSDEFNFGTLDDLGNGSTGDIIRDFVTKVDKIQLASIDANTGAANDQAFVFIGSAAFSSVAGQLRYSGGVLSGDVDGNGVADFAVTLTGAPTLVAGDFIL